MRKGVSKITAEGSMENTLGIVVHEQAAMSQALDPSHIHGYPSVYAIGHSAVSELFSGPVLVEEKIDGSQFSFGVIAGQVSMRSKGATIYADSPEKMFAAAANTVKELAERLHPDWTYRCEYLQKPKHNVLVYGRVPSRNLIVFDVNTGDETYLCYEDKVAEAERIGLEYVPRFFVGSVTSPEQLIAFLERDSVLGGVKIEGIVAKNYSQFGRDKKVLMGKFVSEAFKESHSKEWKAANPGLSDVVERIIATLKTEARWQKAVQHLRDAGTIEGSPRDIGNLMAEVKRDVLAEEKEFIKDKLYQWSADRIARACVGGLPEWYKRKLLESAFPQTAEE